MVSLLLLLLLLLFGFPSQNIWCHSVSFRKVPTPVCRAHAAEIKSMPLITLNPASSGLRIRIAPSASHVGGLRLTIDALEGKSASMERPSYDYIGVCRENVRLKKHMDLLWPRDRKKKGKF